MISAGRERKEFGVPLCVSRHLPGSLCLPDLLLWHGVPLDPFFGHPPGQVTPLFSPKLLTPLDEIYTPSVSTCQKFIRESLMEADRLGTGQRSHKASPGLGLPVAGRTLEGAASTQGAITGSQPCP